jgi:hypothetical protein
MACKLQEIPPPQGKVINVHEAEMKLANEDIIKKQAIIDNLEKNPVSEESKKEFKQYKKDLNNAKNELSKAKYSLKIATDKFQQVEDLLNEYAYYDPKGYEELHEYKDYTGKPIDVYIGIDDNLKINRSTDINRTDSGSYGRLDAPKIKTLAINGAFANVASEKFGINTIYIKLAPNNYASTIAHEKGHFDSIYYNCKKDLDFAKNDNPNYEDNRHGAGDPSGIAADNETTRYKESQKKIYKETNVYFQKYNPAHKRKY